MNSGFPKHNYKFCLYVADYVRSVILWSKVGNFVIIIFLLWYVPLQVVSVIIKDNNMLGLLFVS